MFPELTFLRIYTDILLDRLREARTDDRGMTTETVIITGLLAVAALAVIGLIVTKIGLWEQEVPSP